MDTYLKRRKKMSNNYYIKEIRDLSKNYDSKTQSKILDELTDKFFDVEGIKKLYDHLKNCHTHNRYEPKID